MAWLGDLVVRLKAETADFQQDLGKAAHSSERAMRQINSALGIIGTGLAGAGFIAMIKNTIDAADHLNDLSKTTRLSVESLSGLSLLARQSGSDLDSMAQAINKLSVNIGKDPEKFKALGISAKDPIEAFKQLSDLFVVLPDQEQRAAVMATALGKSWASAAPALAEGSKRIGEIVERGTKLSGMTKEMAEKSDELNDKWAELVGTGGLVNSIVGKMLDPLLRLTNQMILARDGADGFVSAIGRFFALGGDEAKNPQAALDAVEQKLSTLRKTADDFAGMNLFKRIFSADDIAIVNAQIATLEAKKSMLEGLLGAPFPGGGASSEGDSAAAAARAAAFLHKDKTDKEAKEAMNKYLMIQRQIADDEERIRKESAEISEHIKDRVLAADKLRAEGEKEMWRQVFESIDQEQRDAAEASAVMLANIAEGQRKNAELAKEFGFVFSSAFENAILSGEKLSNVLRGLARDIAQIALRKAVTEPLGVGIAGIVEKSGIGSTIGDFFKDILPKFQEGTNYVPQDMAAIVHRGERIIPAGASLAANGVGGPIFNVDMRGASVEAVSRLERLVAQINGSIERRAINAVSFGARRGGSFASSLGK